MAHTVDEKKRLIARVHRIRGQVEGIEKALEEERDCSIVLQQIAACRGAINGLMSELMEGEVRFHVLSRKAKANSSEANAADNLVKVLRTYLR